MTIDLLVQKTVVHNFLRIPQYTFPLLQSTVQVESSRSSTQTMTTTNSNIVETFALIPLVAASEMRIDFLVQKAVVHNFFANSAKYVSIAILQSSNGIKPFFTQTMTTTSSNIFKTFALIPFVEALEMRIDFVVQKAVVHNFLRIPQSTFPLLHPRVQMESSRSSS